MHKIFFITEGPSIDPLGTDYVLVLSLDTTKHAATAPIPLSKIIVSGGIYKGSGQDLLLVLENKTPQSDGRVDYTIRGASLNPNTTYAVEITLQSGTVTQKLTRIPLSTGKGSVASESLQTPNDFYRYDLLAPLPGINAILDPERCAKGEQKAGEICDLNEFINFMLTLIIAACAVILVVRLIIAGYAYMTTDVPFVKMGAKNTFFTAFAGLMVALSAYLILNTINPRLVRNSFEVEERDFSVQTYSRADDTEFIGGLDRFDTSGISVDINNLSNMHLGYLAHQQGVAGASAIIWAAKNGYATVPVNNPFTNADIQRNMTANFPKASAQKTIGTSELTPATFLKYWITKLEAVKRAPATSIPPAITTELTKITSETGVPLIELQTMCRIEAFKSCTTLEAATHTNKYGFTGLFQLSQSVWNTHRKRDGDIKNAYHNGFAAAKYYLANLSQIRKNLSRIR